MSDHILNFALVGKSKSGKSTTGNTVLNKRVFKVSYNLDFETEELHFSVGMFKGTTVMAVDGPALLDTDLGVPENKLTAIKSMGKALSICYGGVDAILLVNKFGDRFTAEDFEDVKSLGSIFGESFTDHVIAVFSHGDLFETEMAYENCDISFSQWCKKQTRELQRLYDVCKGRVVLFNNREKNEEKKEAQVQKLLELAKTIQANNGLYTQENLEISESECRKKNIEKIAPQLKSELENDILSLKIEVDNLICCSS